MSGNPYPTGAAGYLGAIHPLEIRDSLILQLPANERRRVRRLFRFRKRRFWGDYSYMVVAESLETIGKELEDRYPTTAVFAYDWAIAYRGMVNEIKERIKKRAKRAEELDTLKKRLHDLKGGESDE